MYKALIYSLGFISAVFLFSSCKEDVLPKPNAQLALRYMEPTYRTLATDCSYSFDVNAYARVITGSDCSIKIEYPDMKATVFLSYHPVDTNLRALLIDSQKLALSHVQKAELYNDFPYINRDKKVYGMMYEIDGNAATNAQFYVTDSVSNFLNASLYFKVQPNYDSIYPAVDYIRRDLIKMIETVTWK